MIIKEIEDYIERELAPLNLSLPNDVNGTMFGTLGSQVTGIVVCWSPTLRVIEAAVKSNANLIVSHEWLVYEQSGSKWMENERGVSHKVPNQKRLELLNKHKITILKHHSNWDIAPRGTADSLAEAMGFQNLVKKGKIIRVYREKPRKLRELAEEVRKRLGIKNARVSGTLEKEVECIGTAIGGMGQILTFADAFAGTGADVLICGEALEYATIYAHESGFSLILASHEATEWPGIAKLASLLKKKFPETDVQFVHSGVELEVV